MFDKWFSYEYSDDQEPNCVTYYECTLKQDIDGVQAGIKYNGVDFNYYTGQLTCWDLDPENQDTRIVNVFNMHVHLDQDQ